ncbi:hypothetical protein [Brumimicrobium mesophilum]|uniref:hypothetical protein n=1 Tax=Brumimicrobium mesophilum TaxID=392717 RepID=UPI000D13F111|nr:hypothetical protein [Brumimicrobium mesophilum]
MKIKFFIIALLIATNVACNGIPETQNNVGAAEVVQNQTPEVLDEKADYGLSSISRKKNYDIISKLYNEAMEKNSKLNQVNEKILKMYNYENDSLKPYSKYTATNERYWLSVKQLIRNIHDSILRESTEETFELLERNYQSKMATYEQKLETINEKSISLKDQLLLMKLFITAPMMKNYQVNELPPIKALENIIQEYDSLINESEEIIHPKK